MDKGQLMNELEEWLTTPPMRRILTTRPELKKRLRQIQERIPVSLKRLVKRPLVRTTISDLKNLVLSFQLCGLVEE